MEIKRCGGACGLEKSVDEFNWRNKAKGIRFYACKSCWSDQNKARYAKNKAYYVDKAIKHKKLAKHQVYMRVLDYLRGKKCADCPISDPVVLQFDHVRGDKIDSVSRLIGQGHPWDTVYAEILKCDIRCANCHTRKTAKQFNWYAV